MTESKIKTKRNELNMTQFEVALKAGVSYRHYQSIEAGNRIPNVLSAINIASVLNTTVEELFPVCGDANTAAREQPAT